jgi:hypothetical protein
MQRSKIPDQIVEMAASQLPAQIEITEDEIYLLYAAFCGDVDRTAHAANTTPDVVLKLKEAGNWDQKLKSIIELKRSGRPGDVERAINRAINFVQAHRLRMVLENVVREIASMPMKRLMELLLSGACDGDGNRIQKLQTRAFADLASAIEKCHAMTYLATNDTSTERKGRDGEFAADGMSMGEIHAKIAASFSKPKDQLKD